MWWDLSLSFGQMELLTDSGMVCPDGGDGYHILTPIYSETSTFPMWVLFQMLVNIPFSTPHWNIIIVTAVFLPALIPISHLGIHYFLTQPAMWIVGRKHIFPEKKSRVWVTTVGLKKSAPIQLEACFFFSDLWAYFNNALIGFPKLIKSYMWAVPSIHLWDCNATWQWEDLQIKYPLPEHKALGKTPLKSICK